MNHAVATRLAGAFEGPRRSLSARQLACFLLTPRYQSNRAIATRSRSAEGYKLKNTTLLCAVAVAALFAGNAEAIYKCTTPKGVVYQDRPCKDGAESDVTIVINTGEAAPKPGYAQDEAAAQSNVGRQEGRFGAPKQARAPDDSAPVARPAPSPAIASGAEQASKGSLRVVESVLPLSAEEARKTEPTAKYYTTDAAAPGAETPQSMTCESPTGEKRRFILSNGKMTSI